MKTSTMKTSTKYTDQLQELRETAIADIRTAIDNIGIVIVHDLAGMPDQKFTPIWVLDSLMIGDVPAQYASAETLCDAANKVASIRV